MNPGNPLGEFVTGQSDVMLGSLDIGDPAG
jgi:hypothetical protein